MTILELREKRAKAWEAAKAFLDSHRTDKGVLSAEDDAAYSRMEQEISDLGKEISRMERLQGTGRRVQCQGQRRGNDEKGQGSRV